MISLKGWHQAGVIMQTLSLKVALSDELQLADGLNGKQRRTLEAVFTNPVRSNIGWTDIEKPLRGDGCYRQSGEGLTGAYRVKWCHSRFSRTTSSKRGVQGRG